MNHLTVRPLALAETELHRRLRMAALRDLPRVDDRTLRAMKAKDGAYWQALTERVCRQDAMFLAFWGERAVGMVYGLRDAQVRRGGRLGGLWVDPHYRQRGIAAELVRAVLGWAQGPAALGAVRLWVAAHERAAIAVYEREGFTFTGARKPLAEQPDMELREMVRTLA